MKGLKKYIAREPEVDVLHKSNKDDATTAVTGVVHQDTDPELGEVPDLEVKFGEDLSEDQQCILKDLIWMHPDVFIDMPGENYVIQHRVKLKDNTLIRCKPYPLPYAEREELWNEVDRMLEMGEMSPSTSPYVSPIVMHG